MCLVPGQTNRGGMATCRACFVSTPRVISCPFHRERGKRSLELFSLIHANTIIWSIQLSCLYFIACVNRGSAGYWFELRSGHGVFAPNWTGPGSNPERVSSHDGDEFDLFLPAQNFRALNPAVQPEHGLGNAMPRCSALTLAFRPTPVPAG